MIRTSFDELIQLTDGDGASVVGRLPVVETGAKDDLQEMFDAWTIERERAVEAELILKNALEFLERRVRSNRMLAKSDSDRREVMELIRAIRFRLDARS